MRTIFFSCSSNDDLAIEIIRDLMPRLETGDVRCITLLNSDFLAEGSSINSIVERINSASMFVSFYDQKSSSATFELGYALGRSKHVLVIAKHGVLPPDLRHLSFINIELPKHEIVTSIASYIQKEHLNQDDYSSLFKTEDPYQKLEQLANNPQFLDNLDWRSFEMVIADLFSQNGYKVEIPETKTDLGYDIKLTSNNGYISLVEVKKYNQNNKVSVGVIRQLLGAMSVNDASKGMVVSSSDFTKSAKVYSSKTEKKIQLLTLQDLVDGSECIGRFSKEKAFISEQFAPLLLARCKALIEKENTVHLIIDSGTTLYPFFRTIRELLTEFKKSNEKWVEKIVLVTNSLPGMTVLMV